ncbi:MAG: DUF5009 domain-containing protein [Rikenellaceae bacterium]|nr:DUF5009 domain-containing protein [Rikenellaceae bacterium]
MKRYLSLDLLRGLSIFGMVFSAIIPFGVLPAWMYHIQNPPPSHAFNPLVSGISWVDLVFPIFIFCMGAAIPIAGKRRVQNGTKAYVLEVFERFLMLWLFSYLYVLLNFSQAEGWLPHLFTIAGYLALFPLLVVIRNDFKQKILVRFAGVAMVSALIIMGSILFKEEISIHRGGIIIFLLAFLYLFGALIWYFTRENLKARAGIFFVILLFFALTVPFDLQPKLYAIKEIRWFVNLEYFYFLLILIPATYIGDILQRRLASPEGYEPMKDAVKPLLVVTLCGIVVIWEMVALYNGWLAANFIVSIVLGGLLLLSVKKYMPIYWQIVLPAVVLLMAGLISLLVEGSITKSPCTASYCFITTSISILLLVIIDYKVQFKKYPGIGLVMRIFAGAGSNPLMSYITFGNLVMPFMQLTGLIMVYQAAYPEGYPWIGVVRACLAVLLTMSLVALMSEKKIFWRA